MKTVKKISKFLAIVGVLAFASLFIYANMNPPRLSHLAKPSNLVSLDYRGICSQTDSAKIISSLYKIEGVSAASLSRSTNIIAYAYNPSKVSSPSVFKQTIERNSPIKIMDKKWVIDPTIPQCPADGLLLFLDNVKKILCIRNS